MNETKITKGNVYQIITNKIIEKLEIGVIPWRRPWGNNGRAKNLISGLPYRGINAFLTGCCDYSSPYWLTYKQAQDRGGQVRKGEKGTPVIFYQSLKATPAEEVEDEETETKRAKTVLRYYTIFNTEQCLGVETPAIAVQDRFNPITACEKVVTEMPNGPTIQHGGGRSCYNERQDTISIPPRVCFDSEEAYYSVLFHELIHSTGHRSRLARLCGQDETFGSTGYGKEELVAEMGAAFLCGECKIEPSTLDCSAAYIDGWLRTIRADSRMVIQAGSLASKASDYILGKSN